MVVATQSAAMGSQSKAGTAHAKSKARSKEDQAIHQAFAVIDKDESGELDRHEVRACPLPVALRARASAPVVPDQHAGSSAATRAVLGAGAPDDD